MANNRYTEEFKDFMTSHDVYESNKNYWDTFVNEISENDLDDWVINRYANGTEINDGNPLFACKFSNAKALRIIQEPRNPYSPVFASWNSQYLIDDNLINELIIALQPYQETYRNSQELIEKYINGNYKSLQRKLNIQYNEKTNLNRVKFLLRFLENTNLEDNFWNIDRDEVISNKLNHHLFKKIHNVNQNLYFFKSNFENKELKSTYYSTLKTFNKLNNIITLKYNYDLEGGFRSEEYKKDIIKTYSNLHNYLLSYNKTVDTLEEKFKELKDQFEEAAQ